MLVCVCIIINNKKETTDNLQALIRDAAKLDQLSEERIKLKKSDMKDDKQILLHLKEFILSFTEKVE